MKPRILFFMHLPPPIHGVSVTNSRIARSQVICEGFETKILPISYNQDISKIGRFRFKKMFRYLLLILKLTKELLFFRPHIVYFSIVPYGIYFYRDAVFVFIIKLFHKTPLFHLHGVGMDRCMKGCLSQWIYRMVFRNAYLIHISKSLLWDIEKVRNVIIKIYTIYGAIPLNRAEYKYKKPNHPLTFINISTIMPNKGQLDILKASKKLLDQGTHAFRAILIGQVIDKNYEKQLRKFIQSYGLEKYVFLKGALFNEAKENTLAQADVFLFPTHNEAFGLVSIEAMRLGLPVIASDVGSLSEIVERGSGFLFPVGDIEKLSQQMCSFIMKPAEVSHMGRNAFETFKRKFTFEQFEIDMRNVFLDVISKNRPTAMKERKNYETEPLTAEEIPGVKLADF